MAEQEQDRVGYTIFYPKGMDKMNHRELTRLYLDTVEAFNHNIRQDIFKAYYKANVAERQHPFEEGEEDG
jgi:hypothetical protein